LQNPALVSSPQPKRGRPLGSRSGYYYALEKMAQRQAGIVDNALADPQLRLSEAALLAGISYSTILRFVRTGLIPASKTSPRSGHWRIRLSQLRHYMGATL
jgi:excisionase family DNA binding protein